jgi:hypothetical protein
MRNGSAAKAAGTRYWPYGRTPPVARDVRFAPLSLTMGLCGLPLTLPANR